MAEAYRYSLNNKTNRETTNQDENFCILNVLCVFISLVTILADLTTDILVFAEYCHGGQLYWGLATILLILLPNFVVNTFSLRWYINDQKFNLHHWITHGLLVGFIERYFIFIYKVFACKNIEAIKTKKYVEQRNDLSLLHFLYVFSGTIPQIILHSYAIVILDGIFYTKVFALSASIASVTWSCTTYIYNKAVNSNEMKKWTTFLLKVVWNFGVLLSRIPSILIFSIIFGIWTLIPLGLHWMAMSFWIILQKTTFCSNKFEKTLYNLVIGFVYCFCYIDLAEGNTRYRLMMFYTLILTQNFGTLLLYVSISDSIELVKTWFIGSTICILVGTIIGVVAFITYYRCYSLKELKEDEENSIDDIELNNKKNKDTVSHDISKQAKPIQESNVSEPNARSKRHRKKRNTKKVTPMQSLPLNEMQNPDKKFLLEHWIGASKTPTFPTTPATNTSMDISNIEVYTVENTPQTFSVQRDELKYNRSNNRIMKKYKTVCSPTELMLKLSAIENIESSIDEITSNNINIQKRRGICSSDELRDELININMDIVNEAFMKSLKTDRSSEISHDTDGSNKKTSSDSIDMDLDLSFSDINSSDINTFNENIVQKLCLSALKNIKVGNQDADIENIQRIALDILKEMYTKKDKSKSRIAKDTSSVKNRDLDTPTEMLSVHDYENICAVNIAREAWGLRSWNGYSDIENWQHDGSVVRDRRTDTFTSESSEISSCLSQELKNAILSAPPFSKRTPTYSNISMKFDRSNQEDYADSTICQSTDETFLAKPCVLDVNKDPNHLEPILEELDDLCDIDSPTKKRLNSESSLVATIDEIRKAFVTNSPKHIYHRRDHVWDSPHSSTSVTIENTLKQALWKEPSKFDSSNIMDSLPEKENICNMSHGYKYDTNKVTTKLGIAPPIDLFYPGNDPIGNHDSKRRVKLNECNIKLQNKKINNRTEHLQDLSNKDIDMLWQLVSVNSLPHSSVEDLTSNRISTSLQSLIQKDSSVTPIAPKITNIKKSVRSKPRRKFSILRERFEPKINLHSDKEVLCLGTETLSYSADTNIVNVKNDLDRDRNDKSRVDMKTNSQTVDSMSTKSIKEKRSLFMKQVLSPPKFNTKLRHKM
ncbi:uncharacterized protein LOC128677478 [Plodia interpunctella]|uniref:uncharacterized protein LOC128677478 n=1 Tax=Plodia interpunctella TaxID=58824 RepID=UPI0023676D6D|nr:uncharacterized protein LOC128677478 [Plodia interpunctella]